ncbi:transposase, partial [Puniceicoccus vermicola]|nr:transposase [Puniceicoccus vermicola]
YYHVMSRTVNGEALFGDREREVLRKMIWQVADFSGIRVVTYAVMKNHFHVLVEVPAEVSISDEELVRRYRRLYPKPTPWNPMRAEVLEGHLRDHTLEGMDLRKSLLRRMGDVSWMMKTLKQRFTLWFNRSRDRFGPLWCERFKSVLVEGDRWALRTVAAYIDLNAVRAGLVEDPKDYRFCGYAEAIGGGRMARAGLSVVDKDLAGYRQTLYGAGAGEKDEKKSISREEAVRVLEEEKGKLPLSVVLRCRVRYFTDGMVLGSPSFVEEQVQ